LSFLPPFQNLTPRLFGDFIAPLSGGGKHKKLRIATIVLLRVSFSTPFSIHRVSPSTSKNAEALAVDAGAVRNSGTTT
jgi:hypothetical protein